MSPPVVFLGGNMATVVFITGQFTVTTPSAAKAGDLLVLAIGMRSAVSTVDSLDNNDPSASGWTLVQLVATASNQVALYTRTLDGSETGTHTGKVTGSTNFQAAIVALRGLSSIPATGAANDSVATTNHVCPSQTLGLYSGAFLGVIVVNGAPPSALPGSLTADNLSGNDGTNGIMVSLVRPEVAGATGTKTGMSGGARTGVAASFQCVAQSLAAGTGISFSPVGAIGLPLEGV